jgi:3-carboxy-cis,cis-muconate cycloisomerase
MTGGLLDPLDGDRAVDQAVDDVALLRAMLDVEAALARAVARVGLASRAAADAIARTAESIEIDVDELGRLGVEPGNPVVPLVRELEAAVPEGARDSVHLGATSQDILDTALQVLARRALEPILEYLDRAGDAAAELATAHRDTPMIARTLGQPALPSTFGLRAAVWRAGLAATAARLAEVRDAELAVQLGGAVGSLAAYGDAGPQVAAQLAAELGLNDPGLPWHTERSRVHALAAALGAAIAGCGKVATDIVLMSRHDAGEVAESSPGGSSAMPHKRNPVQSVLVIAAARRAPGLVATLLASGLHEQERATGSWHAEWPALRELLRLAGGAAARTAAALAGLQVDRDAMRRNLDSAGPGVYSEALAGRLLPVLGRTAAQDAVRRALDAAPGGGPDLVAALRTDAAVADAVSAEEIIALLEPARYLLAANRLVDRTLRQAAERRTEHP